MIILDQGARRRNITQIIASPASLAGIIEHAWIDDWRAGSPERSWRVVADDAPHIIWHVTSLTRSRAPLYINVVGARSTYHDVDVSRRIATVGLRLRPGALRVLFGIPAACFTDRSVPLAELAHGATVRSLRAIQHLDPSIAVAQLTDVVDTLCAGKLHTHELTEEIARHDPTTPVSVASLAASFGMTERSLRHWSSAHLGLSIKRFLRIRRLHAALAMRATSGTESWSRIAAAAGFADQPHLIRDCREMLGESPSVFMARAS